METNRDAIPNFERLLNLAAILLTLLVYFRAPISQSLWLDETVSAWITSGSLSETVTRSWVFQGQSPLYFILLWFWRNAVGETDLALRSLSILCSIPIIFLLREIGRKLNLYLPLWGVLIPLVGMDEFVKSSFGARPYALALFMATWSVLCVLRWKETKKTSDMLVYVGATALTFYAHYLFAPIILVHLYILFFLKSDEEKTRLPLWQLFVAPIVFCFLTGLGAWHFLTWLPKRETVVIASMPDFAHFVLNLLPKQFWVYGFASFLFARILAPYEFNLKFKSITPLIIWTSVPIVLLYVASLATGTSVFVDRYYLWRVGGVVLLVGSLMNAVQPTRAKKQIVIIWLFLTVCLEVMRVWNIEDWRGASATLREHPEYQVVLYSGLVESEQINWLGQFEKSEYLKSPLLRYNTGQPIILTPTLINSGAGKNYFTKVMSSLAEKNLPIALVSFAIDIELNGKNIVSTHMLISGLEGLGYHKVTPPAHPDSPVTVTFLSKE